MRTTFLGGIHPKGYKNLSCDTPLTIFKAKGEIVISLSQGIGKPANPVVQKGDFVLTGQLIAQANGFISSNVASSCSGKVKVIEKRRTISGAMLDCIVIDNDNQYTRFDGIGEKHDISSLSSEQILEKIKNAGIIGMGGAGFPTFVKLSPKDPKAIKYVIANGAECEPYITCNDQLMRTHSFSILQGLELVLRLFENAKGIVVIEDNKPEAISVMRQSLSECSLQDRISILPVRTKYPQGGERNLIKVVTDIDYPASRLPSEFGCIVDNVGTLHAIYRAVVFNEPLYTSILTMTGDAISRPGNFFVPNGANIGELVEFCGGIKDGVQLKKALAGGPMMGISLVDLDIPVMKTTNAVTLLSYDDVSKANEQMTNCLHCGRCTRVCPHGLLPQLMADSIKMNDLERFENKLHGLDCIACGSCTYICPAKRPLTQNFKRVKAEILARKRAVQGGGR